MDSKPPAMAADEEFDSRSNPAFKPRRTARLPVEQRTSLNAPNWYNVEVKVRNVSTCGFMADCPQPVLIGSYVSLEVPGVGPVHAQVRWQIGTTMGGMFLDPISLNRCEWTAVKADPLEPRRG